MIVVRQEGLTRDTDSADFLGFETVTLAPIQLSMIDQSLLTKNEVKWLNEYHAVRTRSCTPGHRAGTH